MAWSIGPPAAFVSQQQFSGFFFHEKGTSGLNAALLVFYSYNKRLLN